MRRVLNATALLCLVACAAAHTSHSDHDHGTHSDESSHSEGEGHFEAAAVYDVEAGTNSLAAYPGGGSFEEETFAFMVVPAASADLDGLEGAEEDAEAAWDDYTSGAEDATVLASGESATPSADVVYQVTLEDPLVLVPVDVTAAGAYAVFLEHGSDEEGGDDDGDEEEEEEEDETGTATAGKWGNALVASLVVSACSFAGIVVVASKHVANNIDLSHAFVFASGALLTAALLHIIPEALEGLEESYDSLHDLGLYAGLAVMGGMSLGIVLHALLESGHSHSPGESHSHAPGAVEAGGGGAKASADTGTSEATLPPSPVESNSDNLQALISARKGKPLLDVKGLEPVCWNVIAGDLVHNFADGVAIGAAFLSCSTTMGWTVAASVVLHEVPHEVADFMALLNGGMSLMQAFVYNFLSALSAVLGTVIILALQDTLSEKDIAIVLLVGAGSFIFIALCELLPGALAVAALVAKRGGGAIARSQVLKLGSFLLGAIVIGIPLLFDEHCGTGHDHDH
ncbi:unnamed protein product [Ectocarpus sp. 6 AP-2014]